MIPGSPVSILYSFCQEVTNGNCDDGVGPEAPLIQASNGNFYGTTSGGGTACIATGCFGGTVFSVLAGNVTPALPRLSFNDCCPGDGESPAAALVQATNGNFYGTTSINGGIFEFSLASGPPNLLYSNLNAPPDGPLVQASNGIFYGTTGGNTVFSFTAGAPTLTTLSSFPCVQVPPPHPPGLSIFIVCPDGPAPDAGVILASDGNLYGTTNFGGAEIDDGGFGNANSALCLEEAELFDGCGTIFEIPVTGGTPNALHSFDGTDGFNGSNGNYPLPVGGNGLVQATNGTFYGTTFAGGTTDLGGTTTGDGTVFSLSTGAPPFVETLPTAGAVGTAVIILGTSLTDATGVAFNGTAAAFTVVSSSEITTTVPLGATSGFVTVTFPNGTPPPLTSNQNQPPFRVVTGSGVGLSPATTAFAAEPDGTASPAKTITLTNLSASTITSISPSIGGANASDFSIITAGSTCSTSLAASSSCSYLVTFTPSLVGAETATLSVTDSFGTQNATLKGTGIEAALLPATTAFATEPDGTASRAKTITLFNYAASTMSIISAGALGGTNAADFSITGGTCVGLSSLAASSNCTYTITFTPSLAGAETATLSVTDSVGTQTVALKGTGIGSALLPATTTFATEPDGTASPAKTITLFNYAASTMSISSAGATAALTRLTSRSQAALVWA
jgi:hypothetical protein